MTLSPGTKLGPYEILAPLGAGGMGEVYRAKDTRLGREVAVKVLPEHLSANPEIRARFEREAKTVSSLNHPNICTLFDVGRAPGEAGSGETDYLVMELIEGETLAARLRKGPLPGAELLRLGAQIADALDRAHRAGVIHRDLKPGNVMLTRAGAKLMDFGLARAALAGRPGSGSSGSALTQSPTVGQALTTEGTIVGTFQYMAPEQLEGHEADARSDIWALGCVLYEMATGKRAFEGRSQATLIAAIIGAQPAPISESPSGAPPTGDLPPAGLDRLVRACLAKDREERVQTAHAVKQQLQWIAEGAGLSGVSAAASVAGAAAAAAAGRARGGPGAPLAWAVAAVSLAGLTVFVAWAWPRLSAPPLAFRFEPNTELPGITAPNWPRVSPDGRSLVFEANDTTGTQRAWLLRLDEPKPHPIPGSERLSRAYWSPDSREIAFVADQKIQRLAVAGGTPVIVCPAPGGSDLSWGAKGQILLDGSTTDSIRVVPAGGGELRPATRVYREDGETGSAWPSFLPDGERFLFLGIRSDGAAGNIRLGRLGSLESKRLGESDGRVEYAPGDWVLFVSGTSLLAQKLDVRAGRLAGQPITLTDDLRTGAGEGDFSTSRNGVLALTRGAGSGDEELHLADRGGAIQGPPLASGSLGNPRLSPEGRRVLYERKSTGGARYGDVSVLDLDRGTDTRLTFAGGAVCAQWSPDGRRFAYTEVTRSGRPTLRIGSADGLGAPDSIDTAGATAFLAQWSAAGSRLIGHTSEVRAFAVNADGGDRVIRSLVDSTLRMGSPRVSPDGRWLAGVRNTVGNLHVFIQNLEGPPGRWQISSGRGGVKPMWTKGGRELVYEGTDGRLMAVDIDTSGGFHAGTPRPLFTLPIPSFSREVWSWTCDANGERFLLVTPGRSSAASRSIEVFTRFATLVSRK